MAQKTIYPVQGEVRTEKLGNQIAQLRGNVEVVIYEFKEIPNKFVTINLAGTTIEAGDLEYDQDDKRGYFLSECQVDITADGSQYFLQKDAPGTSEGAYQFTTTCQLALNITAGTFGDVPTTGIGGSIAIGQSSTQDLSDFRTINKSEGPTARHIYRMAATADGTPYDKPEDLVDTSVKGQFEGDPLYHVPQLATANLGIPSQAIFVSHQPGAGDLRIHLDFDATLLYVEKTWEFAVVKVETKTVHWRQNFSFLIPAAAVVGD